MTIFESSLVLAAAEGGVFGTTTKDQKHLAVRSLQMQTLQTGLLAEMRGSLAAIHSEVAQARALQAEGLAVQQEILAREQLQSHLEEFVYQMEKLVGECQKANTDLPPSTRFFLLDGVLRQIEQDGIATAIIKGRDNKTAFENGLADVKRLRKGLESDPEVKEALAWAKKTEKDRAQKRGLIEQKMVPYQEEIEKLQASKQDVRVSLGEVWITWKEKFHRAVPKSYEIPAIIGACFAALCLFPAIPIVGLAVLAGLLMDKNKVKKEAVAKIDKKIEALEQKLQALSEKLDKT